jgi:hypothetical protein
MVLEGTDWTQPSHSACMQIGLTSLPLALSASLRASCSSSSFALSSWSLLTSSLSSSSNIS